MHRRLLDGADLTRRKIIATAAMVPAFAAGMMSTAAAAAAATMPSDLAKAVKLFDQATVRNDIPALGALVAEDYLLVNSDSTVQDKQQYLEDFNLPGFRIDPYVVEQPVLKVWEDTALAAGLLNLSWTQDGRRQSRLLRVAHLWARYDSLWLLTYTQLTRVPQ
jgi:ketosteroid isomerase-like protein